MKERFYQSKVTEWLETELGRQIMIPVSGHASILDSDLYIKSYLIPITHIEQEMETYELRHEVDSLVPGFTHYGNEEIVYHRFGNDDKVEPLIVNYYYDGLADGQIELVEEFRQLFNLFYDRNKKEYIDPHKNNAKVCTLETSDSFTTINKQYLKSYLAVKHKALVIFVNAQIQESEDGKQYKTLTIPYKSDDGTVIYSVNVGNYDRRNYSQLYGKKIVTGCRIEECGIWPYDKEKEFIDFILGIDDDGKEIKHSCNPSTLSNYFGANPAEPHYLTPVYFDKAVLEKYHSQPDRYKIEPGILRCGSAWSLYIDTENSDYVSAYLGDLGRDLPNVEEQHYWRGYNRVIDGQLSKAKMDTDFNSVFANSQSPDVIFKSKFERLNNAFYDKLGWYLFLALDERDAYNFTCLRIPLRESQEEFDSLILSLVKVLIDSLNEKEINKKLSGESVSGGISRLEAWFSQQGLIGYDTHIKFLRNLQELRSAGTGHRKGKGYSKISKVVGLEENNFKAVFSAVLNDATSFLNYVSENLEKLS